MANKRKAYDYDYDGESDERQVSKKGLYDFISEGEPKTQPDDNIYNDKAQKMMAKMGYKEGKGLGKREQGITAPIEASKQKGKRGLGLNVKKGLEGSSVKWNYDMEEIGVCEQLEWFQNEKELFEVLKGSDINSWLKEGPVKLTIDDETTFCDEETLHNVLSCKAIFDEVDPEDMRRARTCSNPFETIKSAFFQNRAAMKMANMDAVFNFIFTSPQESTKDRNVPLYEKDELFSFADVCAGPGGFSEYVLWRKNGMCKGFGFTLKGPNDFKLEDFKAGPAEMFETHYGVGGQLGNGDVFSDKNQLEFKTFVMKHTGGRGVHLVMADGGFSVDGQENIQEILSHRLYLCQFLVALSILKEGGNFVCKLFDLFTPFSVGLIYLMSFCFEKITLFKPVTSRPANSERYIICHRKIYSEDSTIVENYLKNINNRMSQIHPGQKNSDKSISEVVPAEILVEDEHFFKYVKNSNERLGYLQSVSLMKIKTFVQNPTLYEERQSEIRKDYMEKWKIPDILRKDSDYRENPEQKFKRLIEPQRIHYEPVVLDERTLTTIKTKRDYIVMPITTKERHIMIGCGRHNVFARPINKQGGSWIRQEKVELPKDTILDVEIVEEQRGEGRVRKRKQTIHVNDVLFWFGQDLRSMSFMERCKHVKPLLEALKKESRPDLTKFYLKQMYAMEQLESEIFKKITLGLVKGGGQVPKRLIQIESKENIPRYLVPTGICLFKTVNEPWMTAWSRSQNCQYFYNTRTRESVFEKPDELFSTYHQSLESSILWFWKNELTEMKLLEYLNGLPK